MTIEKYKIDNGWALFGDREGELPELVAIFSEKEDAESFGEEYIFGSEVLPCLIRDDCVIIDNDINTQTHEELTKKLSL